MNTFIKNNYGDNYTLQAGATVIAGGVKAAMMREQILAQQNAEPAGEADFDGQEIKDSAFEEQELPNSAFEEQELPDEVSEAERRMEKVRHAIQQMQQEKCPFCKNHFFGSGQAYQYAYLYALMNEGRCCETYHLPRFNMVLEFLQYLEGMGFEKVCSDQTISNRLKLMSGSYPDWKIEPGSEIDNLIAKNVASRFLALYRGV